MAKKIGIVLSGCGVKDGTEIHEAVTALLTVYRNGAEAVCMAPDDDQANVIDHLTGKQTNEKRNILIESARIARGEVKNIRDISSDDIDALFFPGGFGAASNLCNYAIKGPDCTVREDVKNLILKMVEDKKPVGACCIAPVILAKVLGDKGVDAVVTIGTDQGAAGAVEKMGLKHQVALPKDCIVDKQNKIVTASAYMNASNIAEAAQGIEKAVSALIEMA